MSSQARAGGAGDEFRKIVAQLTQLKLGDDERLLEEAGQRMDEVAVMGLRLAKALGRRAFGDTSRKVPPESRGVPA